MPTAEVKKDINFTENSVKHSKVQEKKAPTEKVLQEMRGSMLEEVEELSLSTRTGASSSKPDDGSDDDVGTGNGKNRKNQKRTSGGGAAKKGGKKKAADGPEVAAAKLKSTSVSALISVTDKLRKQKLALADAFRDLAKETSEDEKIPDTNKELLQQRLRMVALALGGRDVAEEDWEQPAAEAKPEPEPLDQNRDCHDSPM